MLDMLALIFVGTVNSFFHNPRFLVVFESKPGQLQRLCGQGEKGCWKMLEIHKMVMSNSYGYGSIPMKIPFLMG
jgi:hypothetical protein